jgi:hypothetical protein
MGGGGVTKSDHRGLASCAGEQSRLVANMSMDVL